MFRMKLRTSQFENAGLNDQKVEAQRGEWICSRSHSTSWQNWTWNPYLLSFSPVFSRLFFKKASGPSFLLPFVVVVVQPLSRDRLFMTPWTVARQTTCPWNFPGKNTGVGCHLFLFGLSQWVGAAHLGLRGDPEICGQLVRSEAHPGFPNMHSSCRR